MALDKIQANHKVIEHCGNQFLLTPDGNVIKQYPYHSQFGKELSEKIMDPQRANFIAKKFDEHITNTANGHYDSGRIIHEWKEALKYYAPLLGADSERMHEVFSKEAHDDVKAFIQAHPAESKAFFDALAQREASLNSQLGGKSRKVAILTSSAGGGHIATANAIKTMMEKRGYEAIILNQDDLDRDNDPLKIGGVRYNGNEIEMDNVYNRVFQQDNDLDSANQLWGIGNEIRGFKPNRQMEKTAQKIREINPEQVFSVATHHPEHASLSNMTGIPLNYVHTDFDFNNALLPIAKHVDPKKINFWINASDPQILKEKKLGDWEVPLQELKDKGVIKVCGYPVRESFVRETDPSKIAQIKKEKGIDPNSDVAILSMGRQGIKDHIVKYMKMVNDPKNHYDKPIHLVIVCGKNEQLKKELQDYVNSLPQSERNPKVSFGIEGFVGEKDMADYFKVANALISKPGGATSAEAAQMGVPMLAVDPHPWEVPNLKYLERHGLAEELQSDDTFASQLQGVIAKSKEDQLYSPVDWKQQMASLIDKDLRINPVNNKPAQGLARNNRGRRNGFRNRRKFSPLFARRRQALQAKPNQALAAKNVTAPEAVKKSPVFSRRKNRGAIFSALRLLARRQPAQQVV